MMTDKVVLITGASRGIGKSTALLLQAKGYTVYGTSRNPDQNGEFPMIELDVTDDESTSKCIRKVLDREGRIDVLVNNAGFGMAGPIADATVEDVQRQLDTNFVGVHRMVRNVLPPMRKQGSGKIINLGSFGGRLAIPFQALYSASKAAVALYSDGLRMELKKEGIQVSLVEPGDTSTEFDGGRIDVSEYNPEDKPEAERALEIMREDEENGTDPEVVAKTIFKIIKANRTKPRYTTGLDATLFGILQRFLPYTLQERFIMMNYKVPRN